MKLKSLNATIGWIWPKQITTAASTFRIWSHQLPFTLRPSPSAQPVPGRAPRHHATRMPGPRPPPLWSLTDRLSLQVRPLTGSGLELRNHFDLNFKLSPGRPEWTWTWLESSWWSLAWHGSQKKSTGPWIQSGELRNVVWGSAVSGQPVGGSCWSAGDQICGGRAGLGQWFILWRQKYVLARCIRCV